MAELGDGLSWAWDMIVLGTSFQHWPDGDPGQLRALGEQWQQLSDAIYQAYEQMGQDASQVAVPVDRPDSGGLDYVYRARRRPRRPVN